MITCKGILRLAVLNNDAVNVLNLNNMQCYLK